MIQFDIAKFREDIERLHYLAADAAELGLKPGEWPKQFEMINKSGLSVGNGLPFIRRDDMSDPEWRVIYQQQHGIMRVVIFND